MQKDYMEHIEKACKEGLKPEEVQNLLNDIEKRANNKGGKRVLRLFVKGIAKAKKNSLTYNQQQQMQTQQQLQQQMQSQAIQEKSYQYIYK